MHIETRARVQVTSSSLSVENAALLHIPVGRIHVLRRCKQTEVVIIANTDAKEDDQTKVIVQSPEEEPGKIAEFAPPVGISDHSNG